VSGYPSAMFAKPSPPATTSLSPDFPKLKTPPPAKLS